MNPKRVGISSSHYKSEHLIDYTYSGFFRSFNKRDYKLSRVILYVITFLLLLYECHCVSSPDVSVELISEIMPVIPSTTFTASIYFLDHEFIEEAIILKDMQHIGGLTMEIRILQMYRYIYLQGKLSFHAE